MNQVQLLEMLCKIRALEATILASAHKKEYLAYLSYFDAKIMEELQNELDNSSSQPE